MRQKRLDSRASSLWSTQLANNRMPEYRLDMAERPRLSWGQALGLCSLALVVALLGWIMYVLSAELPS